MKLEAVVGLIYIVSCLMLNIILRSCLNNYVSNWKLLPLNSLWKINLFNLILNWMFILLRVILIGYCWFNCFGTCLSKLITHIAVLVFFAIRVETCETSIYHSSIIPFPLQVCEITQYKFIKYSKISFTFLGTKHS